LHPDCIQIASTDPSLDVWSQAYVLAVDWLGDRFRTATNVLGDSYITGIVDHLMNKRAEAPPDHILHTVLNSKRAKAPTGLPEPAEPSSCTHTADSFETSSCTLSSCTRTADSVETAQPLARRISQVKP
jgi:hypothetical protein